MSTTHDVFIDRSPLALDEIQEEQDAELFGNPELVEHEPSDDTVLARNGLELVLADRKREIITVAGGKQLEIVTYVDGDPSYDELSSYIVGRRQERYKEEGLLKLAAKREDDIRGDNVEIIAVVDPETGLPVASMRKVHVIEPMGVEDLPSYQKFTEAGAFTPDGLRLLKDKAANKHVVEIAALWKDRDFGADLKIALYAKAFRDSLVRDEVWFMGVVTPEYNALLRSYGDRVVHTVGIPTPVKGEDAVESVRINAVVIDPTTYFNDMLDQIQDAKAAGDDTTRFFREVMLWHFLDGVDRRQLDDTTLRRLAEV